MKDLPPGSDLGHSPRLPDERSLDPTDWEAFRKLAHEALDEAIHFLETVRDRPVWKKVPDEVRAYLSAPLPKEGTPLPEVYREFTQNILPYATGNIHPRFFGWVHGSGQAGNIVAELLSAAMNSNCGGRDHGAIYVEREVIGWFRDLFGFPSETAGLIVSGTSMASLIALGVARNSISENMRTLTRSASDTQANSVWSIRLDEVKALNIYISRPNGHLSLGRRFHRFKCLRRGRA